MIMPALMRQPNVFIISILAAAFLAAPEEPCAASPDRQLASVLAITAEYHECSNAVSLFGISAVSRPIDAQMTTVFSSEGSRGLRRYRRADLSLGSSAQIEAAQYQQDSRESQRSLMIRIGLGLAAAYVVFLAAWIWATRVRSRPPRH